MKPRRSKHRLHPSPPGQPTPAPAGPTAWANRESLHRPSSAMGTTGLATAHPGHSACIEQLQIGLMEDRRRSGAAASARTLPTPVLAAPGGLSGLRLRSLVSSFPRCLAPSWLVPASWSAPAPGYTFFPHHSTVPFVSDAGSQLLVEKLCFDLFFPTLWSPFLSGLFLSLSPVVGRRLHLIFPCFCLMRRGPNAVVVSVHCFSIAIVLPPEAQLGPVTNPTRLPPSPQPATGSLIPSRHLEGF